MKVGEIWKSKDNGKLVEIVEIEYMKDLELIKSLRVFEILEEHGKDIRYLFGNEDEDKKKECHEVLEKAVVKPDYAVIYKYLEDNKFGHNYDIFSFSKEFLSEFVKVRDRK